MKREGRVWRNCSQLPYYIGAGVGRMILIPALLPSPALAASINPLDFLSSALSSGWQCFECLPLHFGELVASVH